MVLLKHGDFIFHNILSKGYKITEDIPNILNNKTMSSGKVRRNYGEMPKTKISVTFGRLDSATLSQYLSHFQNDEDNYTYYSFKSQTLVTKRFFVDRPQNILNYAGDDNQEYEEFEVVLTQCDEVGD